MVYNFDTKEVENTKSCIMDMFCLLETQRMVLIGSVIKTITNPCLKTNRHVSYTQYNILPPTLIP